MVQTKDAPDWLLRWEFSLNCTPQDFWDHLESYATGVGFSLTGWEYCGPDLYNAEVSRNDPGTGEQVRICRVRPKPVDSAVGVWTHVEVDLNYNLPSEKQKMATVFWVGFRFSENYEMVTVREGQARAMAVVRPELQAPNGEPAKPQEGRGVAGEVWESGKAVGEVHVHSDVAIELAWRYIRDEEGITSEQLLEKLKQLGELPSLPAKLRDTPRDTLAMYADQGRKYYKECYPKSQKECAQYFGNCSQATMERYVGAFRAICEVVGIRPEKLKEHL